MVCREHLPQLEKIQEVLCASRDEAHFICGFSRVITPKLWNFQRVLHTLATTQEFPRHTRLHSRGSRGSGHLQRSSVSSSKLEMRDPSLLPRERISDDSNATQEEARCTGKARGTHGSCHHSKSPPDVSVHSRGSCFPCTASTCTARIAVAEARIAVVRGRALWESLV